MVDVEVVVNARQLESVHQGKSFSNAMVFFFFL